MKEMKFSRVAVLASGESVSLVAREKKQYDLVIWSNPMRFPNPSIIWFILRNVTHNRGELWTVNNTNGVEPFAPLSLVFSPARSIQVRFNSHSEVHKDGEDCNLVRQMTRVGRMARKNNPVPLDEFLGCEEGKELRKSTGFLAARIAAEVSTEVHLFGFDFYQGKPANWTVAFDLFPHLETRKKGLIHVDDKGLFELFSSRLIEQRDDTKFFLHRPNSGRQLHNREPRSGPNLFYV